MLHNDLSYKKIDTVSCGIECIAVEIESPSITVYNVYQPPSLSLQYFCEKLRKVLGNCCTEKMIVVGDFNVNLLKQRNTELHDVFFQFEQLIQSATTQGKTLIDHVYTKGIKSKASGVVPCYYSYHDILFCVFDIESV